MKKLILLFTIVVSFNFIVAQNAFIKGTVTDESSGELLPFVTLELIQQDSILQTQSTDFDGNYVFKQLYDGDYSIRIHFVGYNAKLVKGIEIKNQKNKLANIKLRGGVDLAAVEVVKYKIPIISKDKSVSGETISRSQIKSMSGRSTSQIATTSAGVSTAGNGVHIRGSRSSSNFFYIDGVKVRGSQNLPKSAIDNHDQYNEIEEVYFSEVEDEPLSTFSIDVDKAAYAIVRRHLQDGVLPPKDAIRIEEMINYFKYDYPEPKNDLPFNIETEYTDCPWNKNHNLLHIGIQGKKIEVTETAPNNLVFLIDVSGSMMSPNKLELLKSGMDLLIDQLRPEDKVSIVVYAGAAGLVLKPTSGEEKAKIKSVMSSLSAGGSTAGGQGIKLAYKIARENLIKDGNNRVILATDGDFNVGISSQDGLIKLIEKERENDVFLSVLGFGYGNLQDGKMEQLANKGNGNYNYIDNILEAKKVLVSEFQSTLITIAKDVKTQIEFNPQHVRAYRMIGYVNRELAAEDFNNDQKDAGELGAGHSVTMIYEIVPSGNNENLTGSVDPLKYQKKKKVKTREISTEYSNELATIKLRYKEPTEKKSQLISETVLNKRKKLEFASNNSQFSTSVAQFGLLLREAETVENSNFESAIELAKKSKGKDEEGYRSEFIKLMETAMLISK